MKHLIALALLSALGCGQGKTPTPVHAAAATPKKARTLVGNWLKERSASYTEGVYFYADGKFARWGQEPEGGWSTPGEYKLNGSNIHFKCIAPSLDNFGKDDDAVEGDADLVWISDEKIEFQGHGRKLALTRLPDETEKPNKDKMEIKL